MKRHLNNRPLSIFKVRRFSGLDLFRQNLNIERGLLFCIFFFVLPSCLFATSYTWTVTTGGDWSTPANWGAAAYPTLNTDAATFGSNITGPVTVTVPVAAPLSGAYSITFNSPNAYTIGTALQTLQMLQNGNSPPPTGSVITLTNGSHSILATINLQGTALQINGAGTGTLTLGAISETTSSSLTAASLGTVALTAGAGVNPYSGGTTVSSGILEVTTDSALGAATGPVTISSATFQPSATMPLITNATRNFTLSGTAVISTNPQNMTIQGVISGDALTKTGAGTLTLTNANLYTKGTTISNGTLNINQDANLGVAGQPLSLAASTTLQFGASIALPVTRSVSITGAVTIDTNGFNPSILSPITGTGSLLVTGIAGNTLLLSGANTYSGPTNVDIVTLQGNTTSLHGAINSSSTATVTFSQAESGTYAGVLNGAAGSILNMQGGGIYTFSGNSSSSLSTTNLFNAELILTGSLGTSTLSIDSSSTLTGTGSVTTSGGITNQGKITPGSSGLGTLFVNGAGGVTFSPGSGTLVSQLTPTGGGLLQVTGNATLTNGILNIQPNISGFYGLTQSYTLLTAGSLTGAFGTTTISDSNFSSTVTYTPTQVQLLITTLQPFLHFPFANANERAVGTNINELATFGLLDPDMSNVINSLAGQSDATIDDALDQMHPATLSALAELQTELGGQLLSLFHRNPSMSCSCTNANRIWVEPFGNWLKEKRQGMQIGFSATTRGVALGADHQFFHCWTLGIGGAYHATDLNWSLDRGYSYLESAYGAIYSDLALGNFYLGASAYAGKDWYETIRQIHFTVVDRQAKADSHSFDTGGQLTAAYFFGNPACLLYPYATVDYLYLKNSSFLERGAASLDLYVDPYSSSTLRAEVGGAIRFVDRNRDDTICLSPLISMGYVLELPLHRDPYKSMFSGETIPFTTEGWNMAWQLLNLHFGLGITYRCFTLDSVYSADISPQGDSPFFNQRANFRFHFSF